MAHMAVDGKGFTNRPQMVQHNRRIDAAKSAAKAPAHKAASESDHETSQNEVSCPACGHSFDAGQVAASRDLPHGFSGGDMGGGTEF